MTENPHALLAGMRREMQAFVYREFFTNSPPGAILVDVYASIARSRSLCNEHGWDFNRLLHLAPEIVPADAFRSDAEKGVIKESFLNFHPPDPSKCWLSFVFCFQYLDDEQLEHLGSFLRSGARAYTIDHEYRPYHKFRSGDRDVAEVFCYIRESRFFGLLPPKVHMSMAVRGNDSIYDHVLQPLQYAGVQRLSSGVLIATQRRTEEEGVICREIRWSARSEVPHGASSPAVQYYMMESRRMRYNVMLLVFLVIMCWLVPSALLAVYDYWSYVESPSGYTVHFCLNYSLLRLKVWEALPLPYISLYGCSDPYFGWADFAGSLACQIVSCDPWYFAWFPWFNWLADVVYFTLPFILFWYFGWRAAAPSFEGAVMLLRGTDYVYYDPRAVNSVLLAAGTRQNPTNIDLLRRLVFNTAQSWLTFLPPAAVQPSANHLLDLVLTQHRRRSSLIDWFLDAREIFSFCLFSLPFKTLVVPLPEPVQQLQSACCIGNDTWNKHVEENGVYKGPESCRELYNAAIQSPCKSRKYLFRLARLSVCGQTYDGVNILQCQHNLLLGLVVRNMAKVPDMDIVFRTLVPLITKVILAEVPESSREPMPVQVYINRFPRGRRSQLSAAYHNSTDLLSDVTALANKEFITYDALVKSNECVNKHPFKVTPRTLVSAQPLEVVAAGPFVLLLNKLFAETFDGSVELAFRGTKIRPHWVSGRTAADLNEQLAAMPVSNQRTFVMSSDFTCYDRSQDQETSAVIVDCIIKQLSHRVDIVKNSLFKKCFRMAFDSSRPQRVRVSGFDEPFMMFVRLLPQLATGIPWTSFMGSFRTLVATIYVLHNIGALDADVFIMGDDQLIFFTLPAEVPQEQRALLGEIVFDSEHPPSSERLARFYSHGSLQAKVKITHMADVLLPMDFLKLNLIHGDNGVKLIPSFSAVVGKLFLAYGTDPSVMDFRLREKVDGLKLAAVATPFLAELFAALDAVLPRNSKNREPSHPDVVKPLIYCTLPSYTEDDYRQFVAYYDITPAEAADFKFRVPKMARQRIFAHPIIDKIFCKDGLVAPIMDGLE